MLRSTNSLRTRRVIVDDPQRRRRDARLATERHRDSAQHVRMRCHSRLLQLLDRRSVTVLIASQRDQPVHRQLELATIRIVTVKRLRIDALDRDLRRRIELRVALHAHIRTHSHVRQRHHRLRDPRPSERCTQLRVIPDRHHQRATQPVSDPNRRPNPVKLRTRQHGMRQIHVELGRA